MAEIVERSLPPDALPWTGERLTTLAHGQVEVEHLHRYLLARALVAGLDVLDVASGEGYGTALLAQTARSVVGVELDPASVAHAQAGYHAPNLRFLAGDARRIPLPDASVDAAVSFETIEHFAEHDDFLAEMQRVLRPGGRFIVSSPERDAYSPPGKPPNPFHARELSRDEFVAALRARFAHVALLGQRVMLGSALIAEARPGATALVFERQSATRFAQTTGLPAPVYLVAVASDRAGAVVPDSVFIESGTIEDAGGGIAGSSSGALQAALTESADALAAARAEVARLTQQSAALSEALAALRGSPSWRLTAPLRWAERLARR